MVDEPIIENVGDGRASPRESARADVMAQIEGMCAGGCIASAIPATGVSTRAPTVSCPIAGCSSGNPVSS